MSRASWITAAILASALTAAGQSGSQAVVRASGEAAISVPPDQARINVGVTTKARTAEEAAAQNASQVEAVFAQLRQVLGSGAQLKTINYSLSPEYQYSQGSPPVLTGYAANNTVEVIIDDLSLIGKVIDAAGRAGATNITGLRFTLRDPEPLRSRALAQAAKQAREHASAIAAGLGRKIGEVRVAQEGAISDLGRNLLDVKAQGGTPIEQGLVEVRATVAVEAEMI
jgi:hypothetical protein